MRKFGLTIDSLMSCDVVTADGEFLVASADQNPDLFWGLRGGGGNFGIVTSFEFALHPLGPEILAGLLVWPMDVAPQVLGVLRDLAADAPDEVGIMGNLRLAPPLPIIPEDLQGKPIVALVLTYAGPIDDGRKVLEQILGALPRARGQRRGAQAVCRAPEDVRPGVAARASLLLEVAQARAAHRRDDLRHHRSGRADHVAALERRALHAGRRRRACSRGRNRLREP